MIFLSRFRIIRITASICLDFSKNPSSFIKRYWEYNGKKKLGPKVPAIEWGKDHEDDALQACATLFGEGVKKCGFFVSKKFPQFGCSPDGIFKDWLIEVKCPYSLKETTPTDLSKLNATQKRSFWLVQTPNGVQLDKKHKYYYQCQWQMFVTGFKKVKFAA